MPQFNENTTEEILIRHIRAGSEEAFKKVFLRYYKRLTLFARRYVRTTDVAEDLVQEVFTRIWEKRGKWCPGNSLKVHLYQMVKHRALDYLKHKKVEDKYDESWMDQKETPSIVFSENEEKEQFRRLVHNAIDELPAQARTVYKLHRFDGLTYKEIAQVLDISVKTVESQMTRSLKKLRERLSPYLSIVMN